MHHRCGNYNALFTVETASQLLCGSKRIPNVLERISQKERADRSVTKLQVVNILDAIHAGTSFHIAPDVLTFRKKRTEVGNAFLSRNDLGPNFHDRVGTLKHINTKLDENTNIGSHCTLPNGNGHNPTTGSHFSKAPEMPASPGIGSTQSGCSTREIGKSAWPHASYASRAHTILSYTYRQNIVFL
jgi:hypothetical protein